MSSCPRYCSCLRGVLRQAAGFNLNHPVRLLNRQPASGSFPGPPSRRCVVGDQGIQLSTLITNEGEHWLEPIDYAFVGDHLCLGAKPHLATVFWSMRGKPTFPALNVPTYFVMYLFQLFNSF